MTLTPIKYLGELTDKEQYLFQLNNSNEWIAAYYYQYEDGSAGFYMEVCDNIAAFDMVKSNSIHHIVE